MGARLMANVEVHTTHAARARVVAVSVRRRVG